MNKQPNILLVTTDEMHFDHLGLMGVKAELMHRFVQFNMRKEGYAHDRKAFV